MGEVQGAHPHRSLHGTPPRPDTQNHSLLNVNVAVIGHIKGVNYKGCAPKDLCMVPSPALTHATSPLCTYMCPKWTTPKR